MTEYKFWDNVLYRSLVSGEKIAANDLWSLSGEPILEDLFPSAKYGNLFNPSCHVPHWRPLREMKRGEVIQAGDISSSGDGSYAGPTSFVGKKMSDDPLFSMRFWTERSAPVTLPQERWEDHEHISNDVETLKKEFCERLYATPHTPPTLATRLERILAGQEVDPYIEPSRKELHCLSREAKRGVVRAIVVRIDERLSAVTPPLMYVDDPCGDDVAKDA